MSGLRISLKLNGTTRLQARYSKRANFMGATVTKAVMQSMAKDAIAEVQKNVKLFAPGPVQDLSPAYKKRKASEVGHVYPILWKTGVMLSSMFAAVFSPKRGSGYVIRLGFAGTHYSGLPNRELAQIHIDGNDQLPSRDFTRLPQGFSDKWMERLRAAIRRLT